MTKVEKMFANCIEERETERNYFDRIPKKRASRPDLHAMLLLDSLFPSEYQSNMVSIGENEDGEPQIQFDLTADQLNALTPAQCRELLFCGFVYDPEVGRLIMDSIFANES